MLERNTPNGRRTTRTQAQPAAPNANRIHPLNRIGFKLTLVFLVMIIPIVLVGTISYNKSADIVKRITTDACIRTMTQTNLYFDALFTRIASTARQVSSSTQFQDTYAQADLAADDS